MIKTIRLENFMAHRDTSLDLSPGVTVITGPNNIGKSAIVEAIRYLVYNPPPKNVIRHGAKKALVHLELDSGEIITWQRQDKNASYSIQQPGQEPEEYHKFGRDVPHDVRALLRLELVETDTEAIDIHLGNQRQPIFLLDRPGSHAAGFFAASTEADYLLKMQQLLKGKTEQAKRDRKRLDAELVALDRQLDHYKPLDDLEIYIDQVEKLYLAIIETAWQLPLLEEAINLQQQTQFQLHLKKRAAAGLGQLETPPSLADVTGFSLLLSELTAKTIQRRLEGARISLLTDLTSPPALLPAAALEMLLHQIRATQTSQTRATAQSSVLAVLTPPPAISEVEKLQELVRVYEEALTQHAALQKSQTILTPAAEPPHLQETASLETFIDQVNREQLRHASLRQVTCHLAKLQPPPEPVDLLDLENSLEALRQTATEVSRQQSYLADLSRRLDHQMAEIQAYLQDTGSCPLCGSPLNLGHFLEHRHV